MAVTAASSRPFLVTICSLAWTGTGAFLGIFGSQHGGLPLVGGFPLGIPLKNKYMGTLRKDTPTYAVNVKPTWYVTDVCLETWMEVEKPAWDLNKHVPNQHATTLPCELRIWVLFPDHNAIRSETPVQGPQCERASTPIFTCGMRVLSSAARTLTRATRPAWCWQETPQISWPHLTLRVHHRKAQGMLKSEMQRPMPAHQPI